MYDIGCEKRLRRVTATIRAVVTGRVTLIDVATGDEDVEKWSRSDAWATFRPRLPSRYLHRVSCGMCQAGPIRRNRIVYYAGDCREHMPEGWFA